MTFSCAEFLLLLEHLSYFKFLIDILLIAYQYLNKVLTKTHKNKSHEDIIKLLHFDPFLNTFWNKFNVFHQLNTIINEIIQHC